MARQQASGPLQYVVNWCWNPRLSIIRGCYRLVWRWLVPILLQMWLHFAHYYYHMGAIYISHNNFLFSSMSWIATKRPSQIGELILISITDVLNWESTLVINPPSELHRLPWEMQVWPSIWYNDKSDFSSNQVSCINITWSIIFCWWATSRNVSRLSNFALILWPFRLITLKLLEFHLTRFLVYI